PQPGRGEARGPWAALPRLVDRREQFDEAFARSGRRHPSDLLIGLRESVEGERESGGGEKEWQGETQLVVGMNGDVEANDEGARHGAVDVDVEEQPTLRVLAARGEQRPAGRYVAARFALEDAGQVAHVAPAACFDPERDREAVLGVGVRSDCRDAGEGPAGEFFKAPPEALRVQLGEVFDHGLDVSRRHGRLRIVHLSWWRGAAPGL